MLLHGWQGFTHIDPIEGDVPAAPFDGRLPLVVSHARAELRGRTRDDESIQYTTTMALMLVNEALRLEGEASAVAAIRGSLREGTWLMTDRI